MSKISPVNVFTPAIEITEPDRFAGRGGELQTLSTALESAGVQVVIYGSRGVGKSSLARQLERIATGDEEVLKKLSRRPTRKADLLPIYFTCDDTVTSIPRLLLRLLSDDAALAAWVPFRVVTREGAKEVGGKLDVKVLSLTGGDKTTITEATKELETDVTSLFTNTVKGLVESGVAKDGVLLIVDEYDRIKDRSGMASLMKTLAPQGIKWALVGVGTTVQELITEHESVARQLADGTVKVPAMTTEEMGEIFDKAEASLGKEYVFDGSARGWIIGVARGHPFYVHLIGKHALLRAIERKEKTITRAGAEEAMREIALKGAAPIQETIYKTAIGHSYVREFVLKAFADQFDEEIHTTELYQKIAAELGIDGSTISVYVGQLASEKYGAVLEKTRERYYRFRDSLFKAYAAARPWQLKTGDTEEST